MAKKSPSYKVKVTIGDATVEVEGSENGVVKIVEALSQSLSKRPAASIPSTFSGITSPATLLPSRPLDVRAFFAEKNPRSDVEAAAAAAYYHRYVAQDDQRRETINAEVLQDTFRLARRPLPPQPRAALHNARNAGYLDFAGGGEFRINAVGYNLVEHALGSDKTEQASVTKPRRRKKARKGAKRSKR